MKSIEKLIRPNMLNLKPYRSARDEFKGEASVYLDANENPFNLNTLNRYPDPLQKILKMKISEIKNISVDNIFIGNGSDEAIDLLFRIFCEPYQDNVIICPPTYGMYEVSANINAVEILNVPLNKDFQLDIDKILSVQNINTKLLFLCSPNNPTANNLENIAFLFKHFKGIMVIDEAYIDFSNQTSFIQQISKNPRVVVLQTLSKAWGLAGARVGLAFANPTIIEQFNRVKPPYNISLVNQQVTLEKLSKIDIYQNQVNEIVNQREWLSLQFLAFSWVKKIYPSQANFLFIEVENAYKIYDFLLNQGIIIRNRHTVMTNHLRITVGTTEENQKLIKTLKHF